MRIEDDASVCPECFDVSALDLPSNAGTLPIVKGLSEQQRREYLDVDGLALEPHLWGEMPWPCHQVKARHDATLQQTRAEWGLAAVAPVDEFLHDACGKPCVREARRAAAPQSHIR